MLQKHFFVGIYYNKTGHRSSKIAMVGEETNVKVAQYVYGFLMVKYQQLWEVYKKEHKLGNDYKQAYFKGLTDGLMDQLKTARQTVETSMGLVVVEDPKVKNMMNKLNLRSGQKSSYRGNKDVSGDAFQEGKNLKIAPGLTGESKQSYKMIS